MKFLSLPFIVPIVVSVGLLGGCKQRAFNSMSEGKGLPSEDPVVDKLRNEFLTGKIPSNDDLKFGKTWNCRWYVSTRDQYSNGLAGFRFKKFNGLILNEIHNVGDHVKARESDHFREKRSPVEASFL